MVCEGHMGFPEPKQSSEGALVMHVEVRTCEISARDTSPEMWQIRLFKVAWNWI